MIVLILIKQTHTYMHTLMLPLLKVRRNGIRFDSTPDSIIAVDLSVVHSTVDQV